jgi:probable phosphoglycerate mutase
MPAAKPRPRAVADGLQGQSFAAIYSSDLRRAWHTASIAAAGLGRAVSPAPTLRERHFGVLQGVTASEARGNCRMPIHHHLARTPDYDFDTGESLVAFATGDAGLDALAARHVGQSVLAFTHGGVLDIALSRRNRPSAGCAARFHAAQCRLQLAGTR